MVRLSIPWGSVGGGGGGGADSKYVVELNGLEYAVKDGSTGTVLFSDPDPVITGQWALDNLTVGRTWKEKVSFKGAFPLGASVLQPSSYTVLWNYGAIFTGSANYLIQFTTITDYELYGGKYDGDLQADGNVNKRCIGNNRCERGFIQDVEILNGGYYGINFYECNDCTLDHVNAHLNFRHGIHLGTDHDGWGYNNTVSNFKANYNGDTGMNDYGARAALTGRYLNTYVNGEANNNGLHGMTFATGGNPEESEYVGENLKAFNNAGCGFQVYDYAKCHFTLIVARENTLSGMECYGITYLDMQNFDLSSNAVVQFNAGFRIGDSGALTSGQAKLSHGRIALGWRNIYLTGTIATVDLQDIDATGAVNANYYQSATITTLIVDNILGYPCGKESNYAYVLKKVGADYYAYNRTGFCQVNAFATLWTAIEADDQDIYMEKAQYDLSAVTMTKRTQITCELGTQITLSAKPSLTTSANISIYGAKILSTVNGVGHIVISSNDIEFNKCNFDLQLDTQDINGVITNNSTGNITLYDCRLTGGKAGATYFGLLTTTVSLNNLTIEKLRIISVIADTTTGRIMLIRYNSGTSPDFTKIKEITVETINTLYQGSTFLGIYGTPNIIEYEGFNFKTETVGSANAYFSPISCFNVANEITISRMYLLPRSHGVWIAYRLRCSDSKYGGTDTTIHQNFDLGAYSSVGMSAEFVNVDFYNYSLDYNTGWSELSVSGCHFYGSMIRGWDEGGGGATGQEKRLFVDNCFYKAIASGRFAGAIFGFNTSATINVTFIQVSNTNLWSCTRIITGTQTAGILIVLDNVHNNYVDYSNPRIFDTARAGATQIIWIFNSTIVTYQCPLCSWGNGTKQANDRVHNTRFEETTTTTWYMSENQGTSTGTGAQQTIAHLMPLIIPDVITLSEWRTGLAVPYQSADATVTNIYPFAVLNKTYQWYVAMTK